jgi:hypothetical protein
MRKEKLEEEELGVADPPKVKKSQRPVCTYI